MFVITLHEYSMFRDLDHFTALVGNGGRPAEWEIHFIRYLNSVSDPEISYRSWAGRRRLSSAESCFLAALRLDVVGDR